MPFSADRRHLLLAVGSAFLVACKNQPPASRSELESRGIITPQPVRTPNPGLGNPRVASEATSSATLPPSGKWEIDYVNNAGILIRVGRVSEKGIEEDGLLNVVIPQEIFRPGIDRFSISQLIDTPTDDLALMTRIKWLDANRRFFEWKIEIASERPKRKSSHKDGYSDTSIFNQDINALLIAAEYRDKILNGSVTTPIIG